MGSMRTTNRSWTDEQLIDAVRSSKTRAEVARKLGLTTYGANSKTIKKRIEFLKLDTSHFISNHEALKEARKNIKSMTHDEMFSINNIDRQNIKKVIIRDKLLPYECAECKITEWSGKPLSLHLDHINGISNDNRLINLRFLCPNCHSQTDTYCGKKLKNNKYSTHKCVDCGQLVLRTSTRCKSCVGKYRKRIDSPWVTKITWLDTPTLKQMVEELGYQETGRRLGVSGNAVKKRIRNHPIHIEAER